MESVVAWLLWMLGFSVAHLNTRRTRDAADLLVTSPAGHFAVVECTTGLLKAENKLSLLHERAEAVRRSLAVSNRSHLHLLPCNHPALLRLRPRAIYQFHRPPCRAWKAPLPRLEKAKK
jgi:hypothetical protein